MTFKLQRTIIISKELNNGPKKPNVIFMLTDDQRYGTIQALDKNESPPNMDRICTMGTAFTGAYIPGGTASVVCMPKYI